MVKELDSQMIGMLANLKSEATVYFKGRERNTDKLDLISYQIMSDYLKKFEHENGDKGDKYYDLLRGWYYSLLRLKEEEVNKEPDNDIDKHLLAFYESFKNRTENLTKTEKLHQLYRFPWHVRTMLYASTGKYFIEDFIHNVAGIHQLEHLNFPDVSYMAITNYDKWALETIHDDVKLDHVEIMDYHLKNQLHTMIYTYENLEEFLKHGINDVQEDEEHAINIMAFLLMLRKERNIEIDQFNFFIFTLSAVCFWHFEATEIKPKWFIKEGKFKHLKKIREKLRGLV